jgi:DNA-directed RNA polymerase subunit RPC12/RpoP
MDALFKPINCPQCNAAIDLDLYHCEHCGNNFELEDE